MPRSCEASHEDSKVEAQRGEIHHIATGHGPMVQGKLLTVHTGGVHGHGWSPGGVSSSRQGAGTASPGSPDLERQRRRYRGEFAEKISILGVSTPRAKYRRRGHQGDPPGIQEASWRGLGWGRARDPPGLLVVAPLPSLDYSGSFRGADFYLIFLEFWEHFYWPENLK